MGDKIIVHVYVRIQSETREHNMYVKCECILIAIFIETGCVESHTDLRGISPEVVWTKRLTNAAEIPGRF